MSVFLSRIACTLTRSATAKRFHEKIVSELLLPSRSFLSSNLGFIGAMNRFECRCASTISTNTVNSAAPIQTGTVTLKKKTIHKKADVEDLKLKEGHYLTLAYATANEYDLKGLKAALAQQKLYETGILKAHEVGDVVIANAMYPVGDEPREILFFQEGAVVFWNCTELEAKNVLDFVKKYEVESYPFDVVLKEKEVMSYIYQPNVKKCHLQESTFVLVPDRDNSLERYTFSHAMAQSARLGAWEARLGALAAAVAPHADHMRARGAPLLHREQIVRHLGELYALRHRLNVESDLLDTPDFYWEEEQLERLYSATVTYFTIPRRTRVLNERLAHCVELLQLLAAWAADRHHVRLELMIIALILAEVAIELRGWIRYVATADTVASLQSGRWSYVAT